MKSIMIFNQKGGVGKSTTAANVMSELVKRKNKVLGIDLDGQGHLTKFLGVNTDNENTVYELLNNKASFDETVKQTKYGDLLPSDRVLQANMLVFASDPNFYFKIKELLAEIDGRYDYVILDCPPAVNQITSAALVGVDYLIIPTEAEKFSIDGVKEIIETVTKVKTRLNPNLKVLGLLITKYSGRRIMTRNAEKALEQVAVKYFNSKLFKTKISYLSDIPYSQASGLALADYKENGKSAREYRALVDEILSEVKNNG